MNDTFSRVSLGVAALVLGLAGDAAAQSVDLGGRAFIDYFYTLSSPDEASEGFHGFAYRRLYLTADATLPDGFRARARLEANDETTGAKGPVPFVKDLWVSWNYAGDHTARLGVAPPPAFQISEAVWGYRSLEKTILDFQGVNSSRDFGVRLEGPIVPAGTVRYAAMVANNSASRPETDSYKRGYAELSFHPAEYLVLSIGADRAGYGDQRDDGTRLSAFGGYTSDELRFGVEAYRYLLEFTNGDELLHRGISLFGAVAMGPQWEVVGRLDLVGEETAAGTRRERFVLAGLSYAPIENVRIIPNLWVFDPNDADANAVGRLTVDVSF